MTRRVRPASLRGTHGGYLSKTAWKAKDGIYIRGGRQAPQLRLLPLGKACSEHPAEAMEPGVRMSAIERSIAQKGRAWKSKE